MRNSKDSQIYNGKTVWFGEPVNLPPCWDDLFTSNLLFNSRSFLKHLHYNNPAPQNHFLSPNSENPDVAGTVYRTRLPFCLGKLCCHITTAICGIPMVYGGQPGYAPSRGIGMVARVMDENWPGLQIINGINAKGERIPGWTWKRHPLSVYVDIRWPGFDEYLRDMRSDYRKQAAASLKKWDGTFVESSDGRDFTEQDYDLYLRLRKAANDWSHPLKIDFFRKLPVEHRYIKARYREMNLGWALLIPDGAIIHLLYMGYDNQFNQGHDTYVNLLLETVKYAIENGFRRLEMGQTAELTKMRLGGVPRETYFLARHTNPVINRLLEKTDILNFRKRPPLLHVFKKHDR